MLQFQVNNQILSLSEEGEQFVVCGARDFVRFCVNFSPEWDGYFTMMRFWREGGDVYEIADVKAGKEYYVPHAVMAEAGAFYVNCLGVKGEHSLATVTRLRVDVRHTDLAEECVPSEQADPTVISSLVNVLLESAKKLSLQPLVFRTTATHLQWKYESESDDMYRNFIALSLIRGQRGEKGERGADGAGLATLENVDADTVFTPGLYFCTGSEKTGFPTEDLNFCSQFYLLVQIMPTVYYTDLYTQILFSMEEGADRVKIYSRKFSTDIDTSWSVWENGFSLGEGQVRVEHLDKLVLRKNSTENYINLDHYTENVRLDASGQTVETPGYMVTKYIQIPRGTFYYNRLTNAPFIWNAALYDINKECIAFYGSEEESTETSLMISAQETGFVRLTIPMIDEDLFYYTFVQERNNLDIMTHNTGYTLFDGKSIGIGAEMRVDNGQFSVGRYNTFVPISDALFLVGNGEDKRSRSNALRVSPTGDVFAAGAYHSEGADYAEYFEWKDQNPLAEDRTGRLVVLQGDKICLAGEGDRPFGIVSAVPTVVGDAASETWHGRYQKDVFGRILKCRDEKGREIAAVSPDYDPHRKYTPRSKRSEWASVGLFGKLVVCDDGSLAAGDMVTSTAGGVATKSETYSTIYCMRRMDASHVLVFLK